MTTTEKNDIFFPFGQVSSSFSGQYSPARWGNWRLASSRLISVESLKRPEAWLAVTEKKSVILMPLFGGIRIDEEAGRMGALIHSAS
ncbi:MAG: hypothetical protein IE886_03290 [Campylobacterales bacterium]|nr:hypothetical protein [Campylobacterales bacterium]